MRKGMKNIAVWILILLSYLFIITDIKLKLWSFSKIYAADCAFWFCGEEHYDQFHNRICGPGGFSESGGECSYDCPPGYCVKNKQCFCGGGGGTPTPTPIPGGGGCGDGTCDGGAGEDCTTCSADCGSCTSIACVIRGKKVLAADFSTPSPVSSQLVTAHGDGSTTANPYTLNTGNAGNQTFSITVPPGYSVENSLCYSNNGHIYGLYQDETGLYTSTNIFGQFTSLDRCLANNIRYSGDTADVRCIQGGWQLYWLFNARLRLWT